MGVSGGENLKRQSYVLAIAIAMLVIISNSVFIFDRLNHELSVYFGMVMCINIVIGTLLANATYYTSRVRIDELYVTLSFYLFIMIADYIVSMGLLIYNPVNVLETISLFLSFGKLFFVFGILKLKWRKGVKWIYLSNFRMLIVSAGIFFIQIVAIYALYQSMFNRETVMFLINGLIAMPYRFKVKF